MTPEEYARNKAMVDVDDGELSGGPPNGHCSKMFDETVYEEELRKIPKEKHHKFFGGWSKE